MATFRPVKKGTTDVSTIIHIMDSTSGAAEEGVEHGDTGLVLRYRRDGDTWAAITPADLASLSAAHSDGGIEHIFSGDYRLDLPDAACGDSDGVNGVLVGGSQTGMIIIPTYIPLVDYDPYDSVRAGLTALPNDDAGDTDGLPLKSDLATAANVVDEFETQSQADPTGFHVNVLKVNGTAQTANDNGADINAILADTGTDGVVLKAAGLADDAVAEIVDAIMGDTVESTYTFAQLVRLIVSAVANDTEDDGLSFRDIADSKDRFNVVITGSNRDVTIADLD